MGPCDISDVAYYGAMPFSRQLREIESSIRERRAATARPPPVSTYWRAFASPYGRDSKAKIRIILLDISQVQRIGMNCRAASYMQGYSNDQLIGWEFPRLVADTVATYCPSPTIGVCGTLKSMSIFSSR